MKSCYQLIITIKIYEKKQKQQKKHLGQTSPVRTMSKAKCLEISLTFYRVSGCCYGYCDQFYDWWI